MNMCACLGVCMSVFGESMCVCATKEDKKAADPEKKIFKRSGQALL